MAAATTTTIQKNENSSRGGISPRNAQGNAQHWHKAKQVVEILGKSHAATLAAKDKCGSQAQSATTCTHTQTDKEEGGRQCSMWQGQLAKRCNWEIGRLVDCTWATRRRCSMRHAKPPHTCVEKFGEKTNGKLNQVFRSSLCVFLSHFPPKTTQNVPAPAFAFASCLDVDLA